MTRTVNLEFSEITVSISRREIVRVEALNGRRTCLEFPGPIVGLMPVLSSQNPNFKWQAISNGLELKGANASALPFVRFEYLSGVLFVDVLDTAQIAVCVYVILGDVTHALEIRNKPSYGSEFPCVYHVKHVP